MEEKKTKEVKLNSSKKDNTPKLTYKQLNDACSQLFQQNQYLARQLRELNNINAFKRMDYLFKVVELSSIINDKEFVSNCINEIKDALTIKEEPQDNRKNE